MADRSSLYAKPAHLGPSSNPSWQALEKLAGYFSGDFDLRRAFAADSTRFDTFSVAAPHMLVDISKNLLDVQVLRELLALASQTGLADRRRQLLSGEVVNHTERLASVHAAVRMTFTSTVSAASGCMAQNCHDLEDMLALAETIRSDGRIRDVVHLGIGGSSLGPELALQALRPYRSTEKRLHVVSNLDGHDLAETLEQCEPSSTLFIVASKSWSTLETMHNLHSAAHWLQQGNVEIADHVVAITAKPDVARAMKLTQILRMPPDLGGRFSLWSPVGLPLAVSIGATSFNELLAGAAAMDVHFQQMPFEHNAPVLLGLLDVWYGSFLRTPSHCIAPYHHRLRRLPAYLQQLYMESNGKSVRENGEAVSYPTAMAVWGEAGTNAQHAFFQWLHQGPQRIPVEFLAVREADQGLPGHQIPLLINAIAQAQALMQGSLAAPDQLPGHQDFSGNRPSTFILIDGPLNPSAFGALLALYEHRIFVSGVVWGINSFDQWGVELGKVLAKQLMQGRSNGSWPELDSSSAGLLRTACLFDGELL